MPSLNPKMESPELDDAQDVKSEVQEKETTTASWTDKDSERLSKLTKVFFEVLVSAMNENDKQQLIFSSPIGTPPLYPHSKSILHHPCLSLISYSPSHRVDTSSLYLHVSTNRLCFSQGPNRATSRRVYQ